MAFKCFNSAVLESAVTVTCETRASLLCSKTNEFINGIYD